MRNILLLLTGILLSMQAMAQQDTDTIISNNPQNLKLKVLYFHITHRCNTCRSIEANVRKTIDTHFKSALENGIIDLYIVNCELPENKELSVKYEAYGATLALTTHLNGSEGKTEDLTSWAFKKAHDEGLFVAELSSKIEKLIK